MTEDQDRRRYSRVSVSLPAKVLISAPGISLIGCLMDTSDGGLAITIEDETLSVGQVVTIELLISSADKLPPLRGTIRYSTGTRHGIEFLPAPGA